MSSDDVAVAVFVAGLVVFLAVFVGVILFLTRGKGKKRRGGGSTSSAESFNDILNSLD